MQHFPDAFSPGQKARNVAYYEPITVRDSSLSAASQAVLAAEVGALRLAHEYAAEAALTDLDDLHANTVNGLHIAPLASSWIALVCGFGGMRQGKDGLSFAPKLPPLLTRLEFGLRYRGARLRVRITKQAARYLLDGRPDDAEGMTITHDGEEVRLRPGQSAELPLRPPPAPPPLRQPPGRAPRPRAAS